MANWLDEVLIDKGFAYIAHAEAVRQAVITLQRTDTDEDKRAWARSVLEGLPNVRKSATDGQ